MIAQPLSPYFCMDLLAFSFRCSVFKFSVTRYSSFFVVSNRSVLDLFPPPPALPGAPPPPPGSPPRPPVAELWLELSELPYSSPPPTGAMFAAIGISPQRGDRRGLQKRGKGGARKARESQSGTGI